MPRLWSCHHEDSQSHEERQVQMVNMRRKTSLPDAQERHSCHADFSPLTEEVSPMPNTCCARTWRQCSSWKSKLEPCTVYTMYKKDKCTTEVSDSRCL